MPLCVAAARPTHRQVRLASSYVLLQLDNPVDFVAMISLERISIANIWKIILFHDNGYIINRKRVITNLLVYAARHGLERSG
jgi:hypothetical protein